MRRKRPATLEIFSKNLRARRLSMGLSQEKLAELADLHRTYVSDLERGEVNVSLLSVERLAIALECPVYLLLRPPGSPG